MVQSPQQSLCWGDDPPTIRNTRNLHPGTRSRIEKHEIPTYCTNLHNSWLLHLGVFLYLCIARSFGGNANSWFSFPMFRLKTKTNPSLEKNLKILKLPWWVQFQMLQSLAVTQSLSTYCNWVCLSSLHRLEIQDAVNTLAKWHRSPSRKTGEKCWVGFGFTRKVSKHGFFHWRHVG